MQRGLPQPGEVVAEKYVISRLLGRGGMGAVYVVEHRRTGKRLALKCLLPEHVEHPEFVERFLREAQAAGRIQHRNVVDVFDVGQDGELIYIVMELLDGKPLSDLLQDGLLSLEETLQILLRAMEGVAAAHAVGIVHRDLKPDNIFVCVGQSGRLDDPRVLDFGISKLEDDVSKPLTKSGVMLGTPYYMAFEQINSQRDLDQRVDVYAMGVILYEAIAGQLPYVAESVGALAIRMMSGPPPSLSELRPELPADLTELVMRSIARDRTQRYPTMQALIDALRPYVPESVTLLMSRGQGTPLGTALRGARAIDATMPALPSVPSPVPSAAAKRESSARLKLDRTDDLGDRRPSGPSSARSSVWLFGVAALLVMLGGGALIWALSDREVPAPPSPPAAPEVATPSEPEPRPGVHVERSAPHRESGRAAEREQEGAAGRHERTEVEAKEPTQAQEPPSTLPAAAPEPAASQREAEPPSTRRRMRNRMGRLPARPPTPDQAYEQLAAPDQAAPAPELSPPSGEANPEPVPEAPPEPPAGEQAPAP